MSQENTIFVGGLSWDTDEQGIEDNFMRFGSIAKLKLVTDVDSGRSRGFAFLTYVNHADAADAIENMNGCQLDGRTLRVNFAQDSRSSEPRRRPSW